MDATALVTNRRDLNGASASGQSAVDAVETIAGA